MVGGGGGGGGEDATGGEGLEERAVVADRVGLLLRRLRMHVLQFGLHFFFFWGVFLGDGNVNRLKNFPSFCGVWRERKLNGKFFFLLLQISGDDGFTFA